MEDNFPIAATGHEGRYTSEASMMNWAPGLWPVSFVFNGKTFARYQTERNAEDEITLIRYRCGEEIVTVFND